MILFIDVTKDYLEYKEGELVEDAVCAFIDTTDDRFLETDRNQHIFCCLEDVQTMPEKYRKRCLALIPAGFFKR